MEIFNALLTPNQNLINILMIPLAFIDSLVNMLLFTTILNIQTSIKQKAIYVVINSLFMSTTKFFLGDVYCSIFNMIFVIILIYFLFKPGLLKSILTLVFPLFFGSICENIAICIINITSGLSFQEIAVIPLYRILTMLLVYATIYGIYLIFRHFKISVELLEELNNDKKTKSNLIFTASFGMIAVALQSFSSYFCIGHVPTIIILLSILVLLGYFIISIYSILHVLKLHDTIQELENAELYNKNLSMLHDKVRGFKYDFNNIVQAIGRICW